MADTNIIINVVNNEWKWLNGWKINIKKIFWSILTFSRTYLHHFTSNKNVVGACIPTYIAMASSLGSLIFLFSSIGLLYLTSWYMMKNWISKSTSFIFNSWRPSGLPFFIINDLVKLGGILVKDEGNLDTPWWSLIPILSWQGYNSKYKWSYELVNCNAQVLHMCDALLVCS